MSDDDLLRVREVCEILGVSRATLSAWRARGYGPVYFVVGQGVRYRRSAVGAFLEAGKMEPIVAPGARIGRWPKKPQKATAVTARPAPPDELP